MNKNPNQQNLSPPATNEDQNVAIIMRKEDLKSIPPFMLKGTAEQSCDECGAVCLYTPEQYEEIGIDFWYCKRCATKENPELRAQELSEYVKNRLQAEGINHEVLERIVINAPIREW